MEPEQEAAHALLHMSNVASKARLEVSRDVIGNLGGAGRILRILRERFASDAIDSIFQDVAKYTSCKRADQKMNAYLLQFDTLR